MANEIRITGPTLKIIGQLLTAPNTGISGAEIAKATGIQSGTLYPVLFRLEKALWVSSEWEEGDPSELGRPCKRLYKLTAAGLRKSKAVFHDLIPSTGRLVWQS
jgi:PadR family transcriptional regulator PadR